MTTTQAPTLEAGTLTHLPPGDLLLERNIRDSKPSADLVASIKDVGVLQPITAVLDHDGRPVVRFGHRRILAAIDAGVATVPVYIAGDDDTADAAEVDRIVRQRDENTHRSGLTAGEESAAIAQLAAFGLSATAIAKKTRVAKADVDTALTVAGSKLASKAAAKYEALTLDQAAAVAEFDDDPETAKALIITAVENPDRFTHAAQRARDDRDLAVRRATLTGELEAAGVKVVDTPGYDARTPVGLSRLADDKGKDLTPAKHKKCPGHVAWLSSTWQRVEDRSTQVPVAVYGCANPKKHGHPDRYGSSKPAAADLTPQEREKAKAERRLVIDNNKAWASAEVVRREWIRDFAKRKTPPKGAAAFIAQALAGERMWLSDYRVPPIVAELLGAKHGTGLPAHVTTMLKGASENRAQVVALVQILAAIEATTSQQSWRENGTTSTCGRYLRFLEAAGYALSDVEKYATSSKTV